MPDFLAGTFDAMSDVVEMMGAMREDAEVLEPALRGVQAILSLGVSELARWALTSDEATDATERSTKAIEEMAEAHRNAQGAADAYMGSWDSMMLSMTGASDAEIKHLRAMEAIDQQTAALIEAKRADGTLTDQLNSAIIEGSELMKQQAAAALALQKAKLGQAEAAKAAAAAGREEAAAAAQAAKDMRELIAAFDDAIGMQQKFADFEAKKLADGLDKAFPTDDILAQLQAIDAPSAEEVDAMVAASTDAIKSDIAASAANAAATVGNVVGALDGGMTGILSALGPAGAIAATIVDFLPRASEVLTGVMDQAMSFVADLPQMLQSLLSEGLPTVIGNIDDLVIGIIGSLDDIVIAIVGSLDDLLLAVVRLPIELVEGLIGMLGDIGEMILNAFVGAFGAVWEAIKEFFSGLFKGDKTKTTGTNLLDGRFFGADLSPLDGGGGMFGGLTAAFKGVGDKGATQGGGDMARSQADQMSRVLGRGGAVPGVTLNVGTIVGNTEEAARQLTDIMRRQQGAYGIGTSLEPMGG
jgi:hypothetical protein